MNLFWIFPTFRKLFLTCFDENRIETGQSHESLPREGAGVRGAQVWIDFKTGRRVQQEAGATK